MGPRGSRRSDSLGQQFMSSTLHRPNSRPQLSTHQEHSGPNISHPVTPDLSSGPRMLMRSFSVDDSCHPGNSGYASSSCEKSCSDYDNVSKYLFNQNSAENIDKTRLQGKKDMNLLGRFDNMNDPIMSEGKCQPFPTHHEIPSSKPSEPRVTFNEPIAETKTFHDPRLDDDDDFDEDSNVSSVGHNNYEANSIIYANDIVQGNHGMQDKINSSRTYHQQNQLTPLNPNKLRSDVLRSPPPPAAFRSSSSTSSNASSSSSSTVAGHHFNLSPGHRASSNEEDTSSTSSLSSAATISLSTRIGILGNKRCSTSNAFSKKDEEHSKDAIGTDNRDAAAENTKGSFKQNGMSDMKSSKSPVKSLETTSPSKKLKNNL